MTPEEILRDLRDIHMPEQAAEALGVGIVLWPAALVVIAALMAVGMAWHRRSAWRREITRDLEAIELQVGEGRISEGWTALAVLLRRIAVRLNQREDVAGLVGNAWLDRLDRLFDTELFSNGPGRDVIIYPYADVILEKGEERQQSVDRLKATIDDVRSRVQHLKAST